MAIYNSYIWWYHFLFSIITIYPIHACELVFLL